MSKSIPLIYSKIGLPHFFVVHNLWPANHKFVAFRRILSTNHFTPQEDIRPPYFIRVCL